MTASDVLHWLHGHDIDTLLAILAIVFATIQFVDARLMERKMRQMVRSMSTRFIGQFPTNMPEIVDVIGRTDQKLDILVDVCAYGHYSQPVLFKNYVGTIQNKLDAGCNIRMIVYSPAVYKELRHQQFPEDGFKDECKRERFKQFFAVNLDLDKPKTWSEFEKLLLCQQDKYLKILRRSRVEIRSIDEKLLVSLWLEDNEDAVFSFQNAARNEEEVSFRTREGNLISVMHNLFEQTWSKATPITIPTDEI